MNILIILPWIPYPLNTGGNKAVFNEIEALRGKANISLLFLDYRGNQADRKIVQNLWPDVKLYHFFYEQRSENDLYTFTKRINTFVQRKLCSKNKSYKLDSIVKDYRYEFDEAFLKKINEIIIEDNIEIVQTEFLNVLSLVFTLPSKVKKVFVHHELGFVRNELEMNSLGGVSDYYRYMQKGLKYQEVSYLNQYDAVVTLSETDKQKLISAGVRTEVISSFALTENNENAKTPTVSDYTNTLSFVGPENHVPNKLGLAWFLSNTWPIILKQSPDIKLNIIGSWTKQTIAEWKEKYNNVNFLGYVDNLVDSLQGSTMIVPLQIGSGIRMKILEAVSNGIPFVTTNVGVEGLPFVNLEDCLISDSPKDIALSVKRISDNKFRQQLASNAFKKYKTHFSIENLYKSRIKVFNELLK